MKTFLILFFILTLFAYSGVQSKEYAILWTPKVIQNLLAYKMHIAASKFRESTEISMQLKRVNLTTMLKDNQDVFVEFPNNKEIRKDHVDMFVTLLRNDSVEGISMCSTKQLKVLSARKQFRIFVQLDKPIYKPGDELRARIVVVKRNLEPHYITSMQVSIYAPNNLIAQSQDVEAGTFGVAETTFFVTEYAILGEWKIRVVVDAYERSPTYKSFFVRRYTLPEFEVLFTTSNHHVTRYDNFTLSFYARYSFDEMVTGNAKLTIQNIKTNKWLYWTYTNISDIRKHTFNVDKNLKAILSNDFDVVTLRLTLEFEEPQSQEVMKKTLKMVIGGRTEFKVKLYHDKNFIPGLPFYVRLSAYNIFDEILTSDGKQPYFVYSFRKTVGLETERRIQQNIQGEYTSYRIDTENDWKKLQLNVRFRESNWYNVTIKPGEINPEKEGLTIEYLPINPRINDDVTVFVKNNIPIEKLFVFLLNVQGLIETKSVDCFQQTTCKFVITLFEKYLPQTTLKIYQVIDKKNIYRGQKNIESKDLGSNELSIYASDKVVQTKKKVEFRFETEEDSKIYVLAFDKRLTYLPEGADILETDVRHGFQNYSKDIESMIFDINDKNSWHICTAEELKRVSSGRNDIQQTGSFIKPEFDDLDEDIDDEDSVNDYPAPTDPDEQFIRDDFPETWIFDTITLDKGKTSISRKYKVPDSITTWLVSAFSTTKDSRLAISSTMELVVKNVFFVKLNLPYSIRYQEVLKLDVLVYNYVESGSKLHVKLKAINRQRLIDGNRTSAEYEFVEYEKDGNSCKPKGNQNKEELQEIIVPYMNVQKVTFYLRSKEFNQEEPQHNLNYIIVDVKAEARELDTNDGKIHIDRIRRRLKVEPVGVTRYFIHTKDFELAATGETETQKYEEYLNTSSEAVVDYRNFPSAHVIINTQVMEVDARVNDKFRFYLFSTLETKTMQLKGQTELYRFEKLGGNIQWGNKIVIYGYYLAIMYSLEFGDRDSKWLYANQAGYIANILDCFIELRELGLIGSDDTFFKAFLETSLIKLKNHQHSTGAYGKSQFPGFGDDLLVFDTAYVLVAFLRYQQHTRDKYANQNAIDKGLRYISSILDNDDQAKKVKHESFAIASYVFALNGEKEKADTYWDAIKTYSIEVTKNVKCLNEIYSNMQRCSIRATVYASLALITRERFGEVRPFIAWLIPVYHEADYGDQSPIFGIVSEPLARMAEYLKYEYTELDILLSNEFGFSKSVAVHNSSRKQNKVVHLPSFTRNVSLTISGRGYCGITLLYETKHFAELKSLVYNTSVHVNGKGKKLNLNSCFHYSGQETLLSVMNEVELPSGYFLQKYVNHSSMIDLQKINDESTILMSYSGIKGPMTYCTKLFLEQKIEVKNLQSSASKVYDSQSNNISVAYYEVAPSCK